MKNQKTLVYISVLILTAVFSFSLGSKVEKKQALKELSKTNATTLPQPQINPQVNPQVNIDEAKNNAISSIIDAQGAKKGFVLSTNINQVLRGTLTNYTGGSWTIKNDKDTLTVTQQVPTQKIVYFLTNQKTKQTTPLKTADLKTGDYINIITQYLPKEGKIAVTSINIYR